MSVKGLIWNFPPRVDFKETVLLPLSMEFVYASFCGGHLQKAPVKVTPLCVSPGGSHHPRMCIFPAHAFKKKSFVCFHRAVSFMELMLH